MRTMIKNGRIVTPSKIIQGNLCIHDGIISEIRESLDDCSFGNMDVTEHKIKIIDAEGCYVMPGLFDFHCDMLEHACQPRKGVFFPIPLALESIQSQYLAAGITSILHPVSFSGEPGLRSNETANALVRGIAAFRQTSKALLRHYIHLRYELTNKTGIVPVKCILEEGLAALLSVMDHSPAYTKLANYQEYRDYIEKNSTLKGDGLDAYVKEKWDRRFSFDEALEAKILSLVRDYDIPAATHDDDTPERFEKYRQSAHAVISEFPLNKETAAYVMEQNCYSVMGAPNLFRNKSHSGNLSARYAVKHNLANILCSDYYCFSLLPSVFILFEEGMPLPDAVALASLNPARALNLSHRLGSIEPGKEADIILVNYKHGTSPFVKSAMVAGQWTYHAHQLKED